MLYRVVSFDKCIHVCTHYHNQGIDNFHHPRRSLQALLQSLLTIPNSRWLTDVLSPTEHLFTCLRRLSIRNHNCIILVPHFLVPDSFTYIKWFNYIVFHNLWIYYNLSIHSPDGHLGGFQFSLIIIKGTLNIVYKSFCKKVFISLLISCIIFKICI